MIWAAILAGYLAGGGVHARLVNEGGRQEGKPLRRGDLIAAVIVWPVLWAMFLAESLGGRR